jgi:hypothetical protein
MAFEDGKLSEWLIQAIEEAPSQFLRALGEAAVTACPQDYSLVRPGLIRLKRKYCPCKRTRERTRAADQGQQVTGTKLAVEWEPANMRQSNDSKTNPRKYGYRIIKCRSHGCCYRSNFCCTEAVNSGSD